MPAQSKVSKTLLPHHSAPRLGSVCPHSGSTKRAAATGQGRAVAATRGAIPERGNAEPRRGADRRGRAFWLLLRFSKVTRCNSGTIGVRYLNNGYVPHQNLKNKPPEQPPPQAPPETPDNASTPAPAPQSAGSARYWRATPYPHAAPTHDSAEPCAPRKSDQLRHQSPATPPRHAASRPPTGPATGDAGEYSQSTYAKSAVPPGSQSNSRNHPAHF